MLFTIPPLLCMFCFFCFFFLLFILSSLLLLFWIEIGMNCIWQDREWMIIFLALRHIDGTLMTINGMGKEGWNWKGWNEDKDDGGCACNSSNSEESSIVLHCLLKTKKTTRMTRTTRRRMWNRTDKLFFSFSIIRRSMLGLSLSLREKCWLDEKWIKIVCKIRDECDVVVLRLQSVGC